jgi:hypothetical protein
MFFPSIIAELRLCRKAVAFLSMVKVIREVPNSIAALRVVFFTERVGAGGVRSFIALTKFAVVDDIR